MNNISFKTCTVADVPTIQQLAEKIWRAHYATIISIPQIDYMLSKMYNAESLQQQMKNGCEFILEMVNEIAIGFIAISKKNETELFLHKLYVDVSQHGKGLGKALLDEALQKNKWAKEIRLTVNRQNFKAINFYFKNGFVIESVADFDIGNGFVMNDFVMLKQQYFFSYSQGLLIK